MIKSALASKKSQTTLPKTILTKKVDQKKSTLSKK